MECHMANCPAQKLLNNRRQKSDISLKCPFATATATNTTTATPTTTTNNTTTTTTTKHSSWGTASAVVDQKKKEALLRGFGGRPSKLSHGCTSLMYACQRGDTGSIIRELRNKPGALRIRDRSNKTALHYCSGQGNLVAAASVAMAAPELMETPDEDGLTPLHMAVIQGNLNLANLLLANKADVNVLDSEGHSVVHWATVCGEIEALRAVLMAGADVSTPDINGGSPLHYAAQMCGANYDEKTGHAASKLAQEILGILLKHPKTSVNVVDKDGRQPLLWAASAGSESAVLALIKAGARVESCDKDGLTALHCAASRGHTGCIDTLISLCGAPTDLIDSNGCTALHYAVTLGHADATSLLLSKDADPNRQDRKGRTPAHCGCAKGQFETVKILHSHKANLWLRNARGDLPVHEAATSGRRELVQWLLEQRPKQVNTTSNDGRSLLHTAAANDNTDMCKMLLDYGADVNSIYRTMRNVVLTPLDCALQKGHRSTAKFLQLHGGLPAGKLRLSGRNNVSALNDQELVKPLQFEESQGAKSSSTRESSASGKTGDYVVYVKRSDSDSECGRGRNQCSHHSQKQKNYSSAECRSCRKRSKSRERRRTSSCSDTFHVERRERSEGMHRCKSNMEIRRRNQSKEISSCCRSGSESEEESRGSDSESSPDDDEKQNDEDCCQGRRKRRQSRKHNKGCRRYRVAVRKQSKGKSPGREGDGGNEMEKKSRSRDRVEMCDKNTQSVDNLPSEKGNGNRDNNKSPSRPPSTSSVGSAAGKKRPQSARVSSAKRQQQNAQLEDQIPAESHMDTSDLTQIEREFVPEKVVSLTEILDKNEPSSELLALVHDNEDHHEEAEADGRLQEKLITTPGILKGCPGADANKKKPTQEDDGAESDVTFTMEQRPPSSAGTPSKKPQQPSTPSVTFSSKVSVADDLAKNPSSTTTAPVKTDAPEKAENEKGPMSAGGESSKDNVDEVKIQEDVSQKENANKPQTPVGNEGTVATPVSSAAATPAAPPATPESRPSVQQKPLQRQTSQGSCKLSRRGKSGGSSSSFAVLPNEQDGAPPDDSHATTDDHQGSQSSPKRSSFKVIAGGGEAGAVSSGEKSVSISESRPASFKVLTDNRFQDQTQAPPLSTDDEDDDEQPVSTATVISGLGAGGIGEDGRMKRLKKRNKSRESSSPAAAAAAASGHQGKGVSPERTLQGSRGDQDSGFEPSPRAPKSKIPRAINHDQDELDGRNSRRDGFIILEENKAKVPQRAASEGRKPGDKNACNMAVVNASIQKNIRRYYMERKIFQHLLELKSLQIRSSRVNEAVLVKRAVDDYHKSVQALGYETGGTLRRYANKEYTFKNFEIFLYETLKGLQKHGTHNFQNISDVYKEAERRLSPDYKQYERALQCTTKTHRCLHAAHAYTGVPCAAYIPMMNHHTIPKLGFGPYKSVGSATVGSFYLPKIHGGVSGGGVLRGTGKVSLELSQGNSKQLIPLPADKLDSNKRYYVTFTVKGNSGSAGESHSHKSSSVVGKEGRKVLPLN